MHFQSGEGTYRGLFRDRGNRWIVCSSNSNIRNTHHTSWPTLPSQYYILHCCRLSSGRIGWNKFWIRLRENYWVPNWPEISNNVMKYVKGLSQMRTVFIFHVRSWALELNVTTTPATRELASLQLKKVTNHKSFWAMDIIIFIGLNL